MALNVDWLVTCDTHVQRIGKVMRDSVKVKSF